jgi:hypothetical protein
VNSQFVCFTGGLCPVRGRVAPCAPESVYLALSKNSAFLVKDLPHSYGQGHMSESIDVTSGIALQERQLRVHPRFIRSAARASAQLTPLFGQGSSRPAAQRPAG